MFTAPLCALSPYAVWSAWQFVNLTAWLATLVLAWCTRPAKVTLPVVAVLARTRRRRRRCIWARWSSLAVGMGSQPLNTGLTSVAWLVGVTPIAGVALGIVGMIAVLPRWLRLTVDRQWLVM